MPNLTAYIVLFSWPFVGLMLFRWLRPEQALIWTILGAYLFLPVRPVIDFPMIPAIDKMVIASVVAMIGVLSTRQLWAVQEAKASGGMVPASGRNALRTSRFASQSALAAETVAAPQAVGARRDAAVIQKGQRRLLPMPWLVAICLIVALGVIGTTLTNAEPVAAGPFFIQGMRAYDMISVLLGVAITLIPFVLGWRYLGNPSGQRALLVAFAVGGLLYAPLMLIEVRLSPQLNTWIYGFFPHSFAQHVRNGGFRPIVFLPHGLWVGIFMAMAILSALALWRVTPTGVRPFDRFRWLILAGGLLVVLALAKSLGALMIALVLGAVVLLGGRRLVMLAALGVAALVMLYPMARGAGVVPVEAVANFAEGIDPDRASSFVFRLTNEEWLLDKAMEKPLFGWGTWGRGLIYDDWGNRISVTDGSWIILINWYGWVGYLAQFGLLCLPLMRLALRREVGAEVAFLSAVLAANLLDLIPNATLEAITWLVAGAVAGTVLPASVAQAPRPGRRGAASVATTVAAGGGRRQLRR